ADRSPDPGRSDAAARPGRSHAGEPGPCKHRRERAACDAGGGRLLLTSGVDDGFVTIRVEDTGVGMDAEALERVFEPYFSTKTTGTGLGLPIARRNVELNGGSIQVASEKGRGTTVTIRLPTVAAA